MGKGLKKLNPTSSVSQTSISLTGTAVPGALDRHTGISGFNQEQYSRARVICVGAGGLISNIAPALVRKGIGSITLLDPDEVEASNLNRQRFYVEDVGQNKAIALARHLQRECTFPTRITALALSIEKAIGIGANFDCDVAICGVDNNRARITAAEHFRSRRIPVIFVAVSAQADHGYAFVQGSSGPCFGCLFPDASEDQTFPCPGAPAMSDILQLIGAVGVYAVDTVISERCRDWQYRDVWLPNASMDGARAVFVRNDCPLDITHQ